MASVPTIPGVHVREEPPGPAAITPVDTSIAMFVGMSSRGPVNEVVNVLNFAQYESRFGADSTQGEMTDQVRQYFINGGARCLVMRVAAGSQAASITTRNEFGQNTFRFNAVDHGRAGHDIRIEIDYDTPRPESTFNVLVYRADATGAIQGQPESYKDLSADPNNARYVERVLADSSLVRAIWVGAPMAAFAGYSMAGVIGNTANTLHPAASMDGESLLQIVTRVATAAGTAGTFEISVDEGPFMTVIVPAASAAATVVNRLQGPIDQAVGAGRVVVSTVNLNTGGGNSQVLLFTSAAPGPSSSVRMRRSPAANDIGAALQLGEANGGIEVGGAAYRRPMSTGIVSRLAATAANLQTGQLLALSDLLDTERRLVQGLTFTENSMVVPVATSTAPDEILSNTPDLRGQGGPPPTGLEGVVELYRTLTRAGAAPTRPVNAGGQLTNPTWSLLDGRASLDEIVAILQNTFSTAPRRYLVRRMGYRIVLKPDGGNEDAGAAATIANTNAPASASAYNWSGTFIANSPNVRAYRLGAITGTVSAATAGVDGNPPMNYDTAYQIIDRDVDLFNLLILPRSLAQTDDQRFTLWGPASAFCKKRRAVLLIDPRSNWTTPDQVINQLDYFRTGVVKDHAAAYWPRIEVADRATGGTKFIDPAGSISGLCGRIDSSRGVQRSPAGLEASILGAVGLAQRMTDEQNGLLNPQAVNALRVFANGIVVWGARTVDGFDNSGNTDYRYLSVRRVAHQIEESLARGLRFAVFRGNDEVLWSDIRRSANGLMNRFFRQGYFASSRADEAYKVICDGTTTTPDDQKLGIVNVEVYFKPLFCAEFILVVVKQLTRPTAS